MDKIALYRQFRPLTFDEVVDQKTAVSSLRHQVVSGRLGHAYLFCGQRGTGKTSIARIFSRAINCENPMNGNPCNKCATCKSILDGTSMDVIEIDAASNTGVDNIKKICSEVSYTPASAPHKVYIIDEVHMISQSAFNALLKTLEEPPSHALFVLATTEPHQIPATVLSRCQRFDFRRISPDSIVGRLKYICKEEGIDASEDALNMIAGLSDGAMRDAISMLDQASSLSSSNKITISDIEDISGVVNLDFIADISQILIKGETDKLLIKCGELERSGRDTIIFALDLAKYFRDLLVLRVVPNPSTLLNTYGNNLKRMYEVASLASAETLTAFISSLYKLISDLKWTPSVRTTFEIGLLRICGRKVKTDIVPLVVPDFTSKQEEYAMSSSLTEPKIEDKPVNDEKPSSPPKTIDSSSDSKKPIETISSTIEASSLDSSSIKDEKPSSTLLEKKNEPLISFPKIELPSLSFEIKTDSSTQDEPEVPVADEPVEEPTISIYNEDVPSYEEDAPLQNQISMFGDNEDSYTDMVIPEETPPSKSKSLLDSLGDSFIDDIELDQLNNKSDIGAPTGRIGESKRTLLSSTMENEVIATKKVKESPWDKARSSIKAKDSKLYEMLSFASVEIYDDSLYVTYEDEDELLNEVRNNPNFKEVSSLIKQYENSIAHVYLCNRTQFENKMKKVRGVSSDKISPEAFIDKARGAGLDTEIHFP